MRVEKYDSSRIYSAAYYDAEQNYYYIKRFSAEVSDRMQPFVDENPASRLVCLSTDDYPRLEVTYGGAHKNRPADLIDVEEFIGVKSHRARGKRITTFEVASLRFVEPLQKGPAETGNEPEEGADGTGLPAEAGGGAGVSGEHSAAETPAAEPAGGKPAVRTPGAEVKPAGTTVIHSDIEFTIERGGEEETRNPETSQLDLF